MAVKFKVIQKGQPGVAGGGQKKYYASPNMSGEITVKEITQSLEKRSTINGADIRAVLYGLSDVIKEELAVGKIVRLDGIGSLRISFSSEGKLKEDEVTIHTIKDARVIFTPSKELKEMLGNLIFEKIK